MSDSEDRIEPNGPPSEDKEDGEEDEEQEDAEEDPPADHEGGSEEVSKNSCEKLPCKNYFWNFLFAILKIVDSDSWKLDHELFIISTVWMNKMQRKKRSEN